MDKIPHARAPQSELRVPTDLLASSLMERARAPSPTTSGPYRLTPKIYGVMAVTTMLTFATLTTGYQMLFSHQVFA